MKCEPKYIIHLKKLKLPSLTITRYLNHTIYFMSQLQFLSQMNYCYGYLSTTVEN